MTRKNKKTRVGRPPYSFILICTIPTLLLLIVFMIYPTLNALFLSFTNIRSIGMGGDVEFIGLQNYIDLFTRDRNFIASMVNTLKLLAVVPVITLFFSLVLAFLLTQSKLKEKGVYRVLFFLPSIISMAVVAIVWSLIFDPRSQGVANQVLGFFGAPGVAWLGDPRFALACIGFVLIWQATGYYMVMHIAAIDSISNDIYEAAAIDGAGALSKFFRITVPLLRDPIGITYVLSLSGTMSLSYILSNIMTGGGPGNASLVMVQHMYNMAFGASANIGYAMAITVIALLISITLSVISRRISYQNENSK